MRADQMPGWYETDDDRLDRLAGIVRSARQHYEALRQNNLPADEIKRARAMNAMRQAHAELIEAEDALREAVAVYDARPAKAHGFTPEV